MREEKGKGRGKSGTSGLIGTVDYIISIFACALLYLIGLFGLVRSCRASHGSDFRWLVGWLVG